MIFILYLYIRVFKALLGTRVSNILCDLTTFRLIFFFFAELLVTIYLVRSSKITEKTRRVRIDRQYTLL